MSILRGRELIKTRTARIFGVLALLVALYAAAGFWLAPRLVRSALLEDIPKALGAVPTVGEIRINPFLLQVTVKTLRSPIEKAGSCSGSSGCSSIFSSPPCGGALSPSPPSTSVRRTSMRRSRRMER